MTVMSVRRITCGTCSGHRTVIRNVPETRASVTHPDGWNAAPVSLTYLTGRTVERLFQCPECHGRGTVIPYHLRDSSTHDEPLGPASGMSGSCLSVREPERRTTGSRSEGRDALAESAGAAM